jgi:hypothetical protein
MKTLSGIMGKTSREQYLESCRARYQSRKRQGRSAMIDEVAEEIELRLAGILRIVERLEEDRQDEIARAAVPPPGGGVGADCVTALVAIAPNASTPSAPTGKRAISRQNHPNQPKRRVS